MFNLAVIIPCYNEEPRIRRTFEAYFKYLSSAAFLVGKKIALVLVNDGSSDKTAEIIKSLEKFSSEKITVKTVSYEKNQGKGSAIKQGCSAVEAEVYGFVDADLSFKPELIKEALENLSDSDLLIGERNTEKTNSSYAKFRNRVSKLLRKIVNSFLSIPDIDTQCGFKFFNHRVAKEILPQVEQLRFSFDIELIILTHQAGWKIKALPLDFEHHGTSSVTWRDGFRYILDTLSISDRLKTTSPKKLFQKLFLISLTISLLVYGWVIFKGFFFSDDFTWLWHGQKVGFSLTNVLTFRMASFFSPVMNAFYAVAYKIFGYNPQPFFAIGILVHVLVVFLAGIFSWQLSKSKIIAVTTVVLTAFVGGAYEPLVWIGANMHSFVTLFILACLVSFYQFLLTKKSLYLIPAVLFFLLALGTKESAIITPALLLLISVYHKLETKKFTFSKVIILFYSVIATISGIYLFKQYLWQKDSFSVQSGIWDISLVSFLRIPLIIFDNFIPISFLKTHLTNSSAMALWFFAVLFLAFIIYQFRKLKLVWLGFAWLLVTISPFIFFSTEFWWEPLASRYNYLPRIGAVLVVSAILQYLIVKNKSRHIVSALILLVVITTSAQIFFMAKTISSEYDYVYTSGRTLTQAMEKINQSQPKKILIRWDHPFTNNNAHLVGAASVIAGLDESALVFLKKGEAEVLDDQSVLLFWDNRLVRYEVEFAPQEGE